MRILKKAPPIVIPKKSATLTFKDDGTGRFAFEVTYEPDGIGDPLSMAHVFAAKCKGFLDLVLDTFPTSVESGIADLNRKVSQKDEMDAIGEQSVIILPKGVQ